MRNGQRIMVSCLRPLFMEDGLVMEPYEKQARFIEHTPKPWEPEACRVDYGNGSRKCSTVVCRHMTIRERVFTQDHVRSLAIALRGGFT